MINERKTRCTSMGAFDVLLELLNVHPQLSGGASLTTRSTSGRRKMFGRSE